MAVDVLVLLAVLSQVPSPVTNHVSFSASLNYCPGLNASIDAYHGIATGGPIFPNAEGLGLELVGRRRDKFGQVTARPEVWVDGGNVFSAYAANCGYGAPPLFTVTPDGVYYGWALHPDCTGNGDVFAGGLVDQSGVAGHISLRSAPNNHLTTGGQLGTWENCAMLPSGEHPNPSAYPDGWVATAPDGGTCFPFAGLHGSSSQGSVSSTYQRAGFLLTLENVGHPVTEHRGGFDTNAGYYQSHGLTREQFPSPLVVTTMTSKGQYRYMMSGSLYWAVDQKHWYFTNGLQWVQLAEQSAVEDLLVTVAALSARVTALESCHAP